MRHVGKQILTLAIWLVLGVKLAAATLVTAIVTDPLTGVAIDGYDPVTYFTDIEPQIGTPEFEYVWGGVSWYFSSASNRDIFARHPSVYAPQYGGHCVTSLARGYLSDGKPRLYVIDGLKLYFFYSTANREAFILSRIVALESAATSWVSLVDDVIWAEGTRPAPSASVQAVPLSAEAGAPQEAHAETPDAHGAVAPHGVDDKVQAH